jgi:segregation and condensation protein B
MRRLPIREVSPMPKHPLARAAIVPFVRLGRPFDHRLPAVYRALPIGSTDEEAGSGELWRDGPLALVEALLFAADEPLTPRRLAVAAGLKGASEASRLVTRLRELLDRGGSAFQVEELAGGFQLLTRPAFHPWLARLRRGGLELRLSAAAREALTIIAYRQPITRADLEAIRGVQSAEVLGQLIEKGLVRITGRDDSLGRPMLYGTTKKFLQVYGLKSLRDLPQAGELGPPKS